ncbi:amino acid carrier protein [Flammeovirgaceae bacterium SG7u.111]|nr:amino acid carrier protein [Flammeovirgaceae bacterium SG7u.132]WPO35396.1 amino acid carrier protein [Flammeovirgaceae bacterium SG7u.111]
MQQLNDILATIDSYIGSSDWFVYVLLGTGLFFTIYLKFPQIRYFGHALKAVKGKFDKEGDEGDTSHFQALTTALSGTVGTGNIAGVAYAIHLGGPAALFWMLVTAFLGMTTKFVEVTLSHKYREKDEKGEIAGGPMYFMKNKLNMKWMAVIFAIATVLSSFGTGSLPQINSIANSLFATFEIPHMLTGGVLAILLGLVIIGGIKRIAKITEKLVPAMAFIYLIGALAVIFYNAGNIVPSFISVFADIFTGSAATGGFMGATFAYAFNRGVNRGLFSNEAGQGSAPIAHAAAKAHEPVSEGMVAILEPFIDTILICTITGLVILSSGVWNTKLDNQFQYSDVTVLASTYDDQNEEDIVQLFDHINGVEELPLFNGDLTVEEGQIIASPSIIHARSLAEGIVFKDEHGFYSGPITVNNGKIANEDAQYLVMRGKSLIHSAPLTTEAFKKSYFQDFGQYIVSIGLLLFAFSTAISWSYYGDRATTYLFSRKGIVYYRIVYVIGFFLASFVDTTIIWTFSGITIALMTLPNLVGILLLHKDMKGTVAQYWTDFKKDWPEEKTPE